MFKLINSFKFMIFIFSLPILILIYSSFNNILISLIIHPALYLILAGFFFMVYIDFIKTINLEELKNKEKEEDKFLVIFLAIVFIFIYISLLRIDSNNLIKNYVKINELDTKVLNEYSIEKLKEIEENTDGILIPNWIVISEPTIYSKDSLITKLLNEEKEKELKKIKKEDEIKEELLDNIEKKMENIEK